MRLVVAAVFLVTRRIDFGVTTLSEGGVSLGNGFLGRMSILGVVDFLEERVFSGTVGLCFQEKLYLAYPVVRLREFSDERGRMS